MDPTASGSAGADMTAGRPTERWGRRRVLTSVIMVDSTPIRLLQELLEQTTGK